MKREIEDYKLVNEIFALSRKIRLLRKQNMARDLLSEIEWLILDYLAQHEKDPPTMSQVADGIGLTYSHLSKIINCLEDQAGWVERKIDLSDRRQVLLKISKEGKAVLEKAQDEERDRMRLIVPKLGQEEREIIAKGIAIFNRIVDEIRS